MPCVQGKDSWWWESFRGGDLEKSAPLMESQVSMILNRWVTFPESLNVAGSVSYIQNRN